MDALLNAEAVILYGAAEQVAADYDLQLAGYDAAALAYEGASARLLAGQAVILGAGLTAALVTFAAGAAPGAASAADLVRHTSEPAPLSDGIGVLVLESPQVLVQGSN